MTKFLESFAEEYKVAIKKDETGNLLMSRPATLGMEDRPVVTLQSYMDMIYKENNGTKHDFDNDPTETIVDGEQLRANGATLEADSDTGVTVESTLFISDDIQHGLVKCLFAIDEETGLTGAKALKEGSVTGDILLNLDSEGEGEIFMGYTGGKDMQATFHYGPVPTFDKMQYPHIDVKELNGGHSGGRIHKGLGNADKISVRFLFPLKKRYDFVLCPIDGGNLRNAIAHEAHAVFGLHPKNKENVRILLDCFAVDVENELEHIDPNTQLTAESTDRPEYHTDNATAEKLTYALHACPHGVIGMSHDIEGLIGTSTNLVSIETKEGNTILIGTGQHNSVESCKITIADTVTSTFLLTGADIKYGDGYSGRAPNPDSKILKITQETYKRLFDKDAKIMTIRVGLECGLFLKKYSKLDMISPGFTLCGIHSPNGRIETATIGLWWGHLLELLKSIPVK